MVGVVVSNMMGCCLDVKLGLSSDLFSPWQSLKQASLCSFGLTKTFTESAPFLAMAEFEASFTLLIWLDENVHESAPFLAFREQR